MDIVEFFLDIERNDLQYLLTNPRARNTKKQQQMTSAYFQASRKMWREQGRNLSEEEKQKVIRAAECAYNKEVRQRRKAITFDKVALVTL
jgi:hypothetical protein